MNPASEFIMNLVPHPLTLPTTLIFYLEMRFLASFWVQIDATSVQGGDERFDRVNVFVGRINSEV